MANIRDVDKLKELVFELGRSRPVRDPLSSAMESELHGPQLHAVVWLGHDGALKLGELARRLCVTEKGVTGVADRLEKAKYCERVRDGVDRRVVRLKLTRKGEQLYKVVDERLQLKLSVLLSALGTTDRDALFRILKRLRSHLESLADGHSLLEKKQ